VNVAKQEPGSTTTDGFQAAESFFSNSPAKSRTTKLI
jgi:hypothetical protein